MESNSIKAENHLTFWGKKGPQMSIFEQFEVIISSSGGLGWGVDFPVEPVVSQQASEEKAV